MAISTVVCIDSVADELVDTICQLLKRKRIGPAYHITTDLGPLISSEHQTYVSGWIQRGVEEGAKLVLDGRNTVVPGFESGYYLGYTIFDHVTPDMSIGNSEIFGPVLCIKRVSSFEEGLELINASELANSAVIYTSSGFLAQEFTRRVHAGMVGVNVGIPSPSAGLPFSGHKGSFLGDLHVLGEDGLRFYTETKVVTTRWFTEKEAAKL